MKPTPKAPAITKTLEYLAGRTTAITGDHCVKPPFGCGKPAPASSFRDYISLKEYRISGLCQHCQDKFFN
jgi:hypothetical protein